MLLIQVPAQVEERQAEQIMCSNNVKKGIRCNWRIVDMEDVLSWVWC
jgi:hypothetical protein